MRIKTDWRSMERVALVLLLAAGGAVLIGAAASDVWRVARGVLAVRASLGAFGAASVLVALLAVVFPAREG